MKRCSFILRPWFILKTRYASNQIVMFELLWELFFVVVPAPAKKTNLWRSTLVKLTGMQCMHMLSLLSTVSLLLLLVHLGSLPSTVQDCLWAPEHRRIICAFFGQAIAYNSCRNTHRRLVRHALAVLTAGEEPEFLSGTRAVIVPNGLTQPAKLLCFTRPGLRASFLLDIPCH